MVKEQSTLYDTATADHNEEFDEEFEPVSLAEAYDNVDSEWDHEDIPLRWLFAKDGRGGLVEYAIKAVVREELVYRNQTSLGEKAGVSRHSVHRHVDDLVTLGIYKQHGGNGTTARFKPNKKSKVLRALYTANREIEQYAGESL